MRPDVTTLRRSPFRRPLLVLAVSAACGAAALGLLPGAAPRADALTASDVVGTWKLKLSGEGWQSDAGAYELGRPRGAAFLVVRHADSGANTGLLELEIVLDGVAQDSLVGAAVPPKGSAPAFRAKARIVENTISAIYVGQPDYVNALNLRFESDARKVAGTWFLAFPAVDAPDAQKFATGIDVAMRGKRVRGGGPKPLTPTRSPTSR